jgi:sugar lactone lactonase YvrE
MPTTRSTDESITVYTLPSYGAEDVLVGDDGHVFTGTEDGSIYELDPATGATTLLGNTGGRPLGLEWLDDGRILVCDAHAGLLTLDRRSGEVEVLVDSVAGRKLVFCNNAAVHSNGVIYFSDSSKCYSVEVWKHDMVEDTHTGRLLQRDRDGAVSVLVEGLRFANGVALSADESFVVVAETTGRSVVRRWLEGPKRGRVDHLVTDLPGYPDNIARGSDGLIWVTIASPIDATLELLLKRVPLGLRKQVLRTPEKLQPKPRRTARVMAYDDEGQLVHDRSLATDEFHMVTGVREHNGKVWLGSLHEPSVAVFHVH